MTIKGINAMTTNLNIRIDKELKDKVEKVLNELGMNLTTGINIFLRTVVRENAIPFEIRINEPNKETKLAIEEGKKIVRSTDEKGYSSIKDLKESLSDK